MLEDIPHVHFIGIGGIGMSYLARYFKSQNWAVSGSDRAASSLTRKLNEEGIQVKIGHKSANLGPKTLLVVTSQAIQADNPEIVQANHLGLPITSFPKVVGGLTSSYETIAVAGAHGKSTTTSLIALILIEAGLDPTVMVGTKLKELPLENFRAGRSSYLVLEADEYGRAFLNYSPAIAVVTNIDREHLDIYKDLSDIKKTFLKFLSRTKRPSAAEAMAGKGGALVLNADDKNLSSLKKQIRVLAHSRHYKVAWYSLKSADAKKIERTIKVPGKHNISNALAALNVARFLGVKDGKTFSTIGNYSGSWRRMEYRGTLDVRSRLLDVKKENRSKISGPTSNFRTSTIQIFDDYAHHPTEIRATLGAFKEKYPHSPLICVFQPHQEKRLTLLFEDFVGAFTDADILILLPMYKVAGREASVTSLPAKASAVTGRLAPHRTDSKALFRAVRKKYPHRAIFYLSDSKRLKNELIRIVRTTARPNQYKSAVVIMMGAGNIFEYTQSLLD